MISGVNLVKTRSKARRCNMFQFYSIKSNVTVLLPKSKNVLANLFLREKLRNIKAILSIYINLSQTGEKAIIKKIITYVPNYIQTNQCVI